MEGLASAASVLAIIDVSAKIASLCFQYSVAVKNAKKDIERLQAKVNAVEIILSEIKQLLESQDGTRLATTRKLSAPLGEYARELEALRTRLDPGKARTVMKRVGLQALKWPFTSKEVEKIVASLGAYEQTFSTALLTDQAFVSCAWMPLLHVEC
jgi:DNA-binding transcriptional MerR regulator